MLVWALETKRSEGQPSQRLLEFNNILGIRVEISSDVARIHNQLGMGYNPFITDIAMIGGDDHTVCCPDNGLVKGHMGGSIKMAKLSRKCIIKTHMRAFILKNF